MLTNMALKCFVIVQSTKTYFIFLWRDLSRSRAVTKLLIVMSYNFIQKLYYLCVVFLLVYDSSVIFFIHDMFTN